MPVLTMPDLDTGADPRPVPWQGMLWVTWRQHRGLLISILVAFVAVMVSMVIFGLKIHHDYAMLRACRPAASSACTGLSSLFNSTDWHLGNGIHVAVLAVPALLAMSAGPPVLARELEAGTYLVRRVLPAMAITLPVFVGLAALTWFDLRGHYRVRTFWPMQFFETGWLLLLSTGLFTATVQLVRHRAA